MASSKFGSTSVNRVITICMLKLKSEQNKISVRYGVRYSCLIDLPYFNPICYAIIDPMHNLYLGTAKYMMELWTERGILTKNDFTIIEGIVASITTPRDIGRIPLKIASSFSGLLQTNGETGLP